MLLLNEEGPSRCVRRCRLLPHLDLEETTTGPAGTRKPGRHAMNVLPKYTERRFVWDFAQATPRDYYPSQNTQASADGTSSTYHIDSRRALETPRAGMNAGHRRAQTIWIRCWLALSQRLGQYFNPFLLLAQTDMQILSATKATEIGRLLR
ncbi:hypothetical protein LY78DRAFT_122361 [Colletotrichum sublineola]|nr:hypothetical protein LY78DRAFT_122361 [Colletotrichum sublineola]